MQHNAYTHSGAIGIGGNCNANDFPSSHSSNNNHVINAIQTSLQQNNSSNNGLTTASTATKLTTATTHMNTYSFTNGETSTTTPNDMASSGIGAASASAVNYGATFFGNEYHHQLTQKALMANTSTYASATSAAAMQASANTAMLTNYCDAAMMMAAAAVNANQCLQQQQQRIALIANYQNESTKSVDNNDEHKLQILAKDTTPPLNIESPPNLHHNHSTMATSLVSTALSSTSSSTSITSSSSSLLSSSAATSPSITLVNTSSLTSPNVNNVATAAELVALQDRYQHAHHQQHQNHHHNVEPETSPNFIDISEVPLIVDVK